MRRPHYLGTAIYLNHIKRMDPRVVCMKTQMAIRVPVLGGIDGQVFFKKLFGGIGYLHDVILIRTGDRQRTLFFFREVNLKINQEQSLNYYGVSNRYPSIIFLIRRLLFIKPVIPRAHGRSIFFNQTVSQNQ